jgi:hypothetical protein
MKQRSLAGHVTSTGATTAIPAAEFAKHLSLLIGVGCKLEKKDGKETMVAMETFPNLYVHSGKESVALPEHASQMLPNNHHVVHESGSVTQETFSAFLMDILLPFIKSQFPTLKKDEREFLLVYDIPSVHNVSDAVLKAFLEAGIIIYGLPPNSTLVPTMRQSVRVWRFQAGLLSVNRVVPDSPPKTTNSHEATRRQRLAPSHQAGMGEEHYTTQNRCGLH